MMIGFGMVGFFGRSRRQAGFRDPRPEALRIRQQRRTKTVVS
jgi:hypothetical protein